MTVRFRACWILAALAVSVWIGPTLAQESPSAYTYLEEPVPEGAFDLTFQLQIPVNTPPGTWAEVLLASPAERQGYVVRFSATEIHLLRWPHSQPILLAQASVPLPPREAAYQWTIKCRPGRLAILCDHRLVLTADEPGAWSGRVGWAVLTEGVQVTDFRYQPVEEIYFSDDFMRADGQSGDWQAVVGHWENVAAETRPDLNANAFVYQAQAQPEALAVAGYSFWDSYEFSASVKPVGDGAIGLVCNYQNPGHYLLFRWFSFTSSIPRGQRKQLLLVRGGEPQVLAWADGGFVPDQWYRLRVRTVSGTVQCWVDDVCVFDVDGSKLSDGTPCLLPSEGGVGLYAYQMVGARFDDVVVESIGPDPVPGAGAWSWSSEPRLVEQFRQEDTMKGWASPGGAWVPPPTGLSLPRWEPEPLWHKGDFFGDYEIELTFRNLKPRAGTAQAILCGDLADPKSGYVLRFHHEADQPILELELSRRGVAIAQAQVELVGDQSPVLTFGRRGREVVGRADSQTVLQFVDPEPLTGTKLGLVRGLPIDFEDVRVRGRQLYDYTFSSAPTDWFVQSGRWAIADRWKCFPGWAWFSGRSDQLALIWNKRRFFGDLSLELYGAVQMDSPQAPHYLHPSDLNVTICGNGRDLGSGYSFVFGGWGNQATAILREGQVVRTSKNPAHLFRIGGNELFHRRWFYLKIEKLGGDIRYYLDNALIAEFHDSDPLPGGQIALWTWDNGMMYARVKIYYEREEPFVPFVPEDQYEPLTPVSPTLPRVVLTSETHPATVTDFEGPVEGWQRPSEEPYVRLAAVEEGPHGHSLRVENRRSGGLFGVQVPLAPVDLSQRFLLSFDYRLDPTVRINLHLQVNDRSYTIPLTGPRSQSHQGTLLPPLEVIADGNWHHAEYNLLEALRQSPSDGNLWLQSCFMGNTSNEDYLLAGFHADREGRPIGNEAGCSYALDNFCLTGPRPGPVKLQWSAPDGLAVTQWRYSLSQDPHAGPDQTWGTVVESAEHGAQSTEFENLGDGRWYFQLQPVGAGKGGPVYCYGLAVDSTPPRCRNPYPSPGSTSGLTKIVVGLEDESGLDLATVKVRVQGRDFQVKPPFLEYSDGQLRLDLATIGLPLENGQTIQVTVLEAQDCAGNALREPFSWTWTYDQKKTFILE